MQACRVIATRCHGAGAPSSSRRSAARRTNRIGAPCIHHRYCPLNARTDRRVGFVSVSSYRDREEALLDSVLLLILVLVFVISDTSSAMLPGGLLVKRSHLPSEETWWFRQQRHLNEMRSLRWSLSP